MSYVPQPMTAAGRQYAMNRDQYNVYYGEAFGVRIGDWDVGFCACFRDLIPNTCMVTCLPFVSLAQIASRTSMTRYSYMLIGAMVVYLVEAFTALMAFYLIFGSTLSLVNDHDDDLSTSDEPYYPRYGSKYDDHLSSALNITAGVFVLTISSGCAFVWFIIVWQVRSRVRGRFQIPGGCLEDCCLSYWCACCTIAQMATHVKSYTPGSCDLGPPRDSIPAYQA